MPTLNKLLQQICDDEKSDLRALEAILVEQIGTRSGARRGTVSDQTSIVVQPVPLHPREADHAIATAVDWIARRIKLAGAATFTLSLSRQSSRLVLVAQWPRTNAATTQHPAPPLRRSSLAGMS